MKKLGVIALVVLPALISLASSATAEAPKCPDTSKVRSGTEFCESRNFDKSFPDVAYCDSPQERRRKVCPQEQIEGEWAGDKQGDIDPYQAEIDEALKALSNNPDPDTELQSRQKICMRSRSTVVFLEPRQKLWKLLSRGKYGLEALKEVDAQMKTSRELEKKYCGKATK